MTQTYADFAVQVEAVLDKTISDNHVFEKAVETVTAMVVGGFIETGHED